jgi:hypothetical protein
MKRELNNIYERVLATSARVREIKEVRAAAIEIGHYELNQYKKHETPAQIVDREIEAGVIGRDYLMKAVSKTNKRNKDYNKTKRR